MNFALWTASATSGASASCRCSTMTGQTFAPSVSKCSRARATARSGCSNAAAAGSTTTSFAPERSSNSRWRSRTPSRHSPPPTRTSVPPVRRAVTVWEPPTFGENAKLKVMSGTTSPLVSTSIKYSAPDSNSLASAGASGFTQRIRIDLPGSSVSSPGLRNAKTSVMSVLASPLGGPTLAVSSSTVMATGPGESRWSDIRLLPSSLFSGRPGQALC